jgi:hypothetical protein
VGPISLRCARSERQFETALSMQSGYLAVHQERALSIGPPLPTRCVREALMGNKRATDGTEFSRAQTNSSRGIEPNPEPRRAPPNSIRGLRNRRSQVRILSGALRLRWDLADSIASRLAGLSSGATLGSMSVAPLWVAFSLQETLPILFLSLVGSAVFVGLLLCVRRFDAEEGTDSDGKGGGGGRNGPRPDHPVGPLAVVDPPLGEIRASRERSSAEPPLERRERETAIGRASRARA